MSPYRGGGPGYFGGLLLLPVIGQWLWSVSRPLFRTFSRTDPCHDSLPMRWSWPWSVPLVVAAMLVASSSAADVDLLPPVFATPGGFTRTPALVGVTNPNASGAIFYTMDGTDPRGHFGEVTPQARRYIAPLSVTHSQIIRARVKSGTNWSEFVAAAFTADHFSNRREVREELDVEGPTDKNEDRNCGYDESAECRARAMAQVIRP